MIKGVCENYSALLILLIFYLKIHKKSNLSLDNTTFKWGGGGGIIMKYIFFSNTRWTQLLTPLEILCKIFQKFIPNHIHNLEHSRVIMNMKLSSHGFLFHRNINRRENKARIPLIVNHNEKKKIYIFF